MQKKKKDVCSTHNQNGMLVWAGDHYYFIILQIQFLYNFISVRDGPEKKGRNKAEMKERKKTTLDLLCIFADVG